MCWCGDTGNEEGVVCGRAGCKEPEYIRADSARDSYADTVTVERAGTEDDGEIDAPDFAGLKDLPRQTDAEREASCGGHYSMMATLGHG
jgi:hypothetical protein